MATVKSPEGEAEKPKRKVLSVLGAAVMASPISLYWLSDRH